MSLYQNLNNKKKLGTSNSKKNSTVSPKSYSLMKQKKGGFAPDKKDKDK